MGSLAFLIMFAGLCYIYYQQTTAPYREGKAHVDKIRREPAKVVNKPTEQPTETTAESITPTTQNTDNPTINIEDIISKLGDDYIISTKKEDVEEVQNPIDIEKTFDEQYMEYVNELQNNLSQFDPKIQKKMREVLEIPTKEEYREELRYYQSLSQSEMEDIVEASIKRVSEITEKFGESIRRSKNE